MRPKIWLKGIWAGLFCALLFLCAAQAQAAVSVEAEMGYGGAVTYLSTMPLRVTLKNDGADAALTVAVNIARSQWEYDRYEYSVFLAGGAEKRLTIPLTLNYKQASYTVEVLEGEEMIARKEAKPQRIVAPNTLLVGALTDNIQGLRAMNITSGNDQLMLGDTWQVVQLDADTFPDSVEMMRAFRILVVDGIDVSALSKQQRNAMEQWLREGGIILVGGGTTAVTSFKGFAALTGITTAAPYQAQGVDQALADALSGGQYALSAQERVQSAVMLSALRGSRNAVASLNGDALVDRCPVEAGVIYTAAFSLSERPLSAWSGMSGYWQRMLLAHDKAQYDRIIKELNNYYERDDEYVDQWLLRNLKMDNPDSVLLIVLLIGAFVVCSGIGSYLLLKKMDKREWMWLTVPVLSLAFAAAVMGLSSRMQLNKPAASAYTVLLVDKTGRTENRVMAGIASADTAPLRVSAGEGDVIRPNVVDYGYFDDDEEQSRREPKLRYTYSNGDRAAMTMPASSAWSVQSLRIIPEKKVDCPVAATIWWEQDGLHGRIENRSGLVLEPGYVLTGLGFCSIPELAPGAEKEFAIVKNPNRKQEQNSEKIYDGELIENARDYGMYSVVNAAVFQKLQLDETYRYSETEMAECNRRENLLENCMRRWEDNVSFRYVTFSRQISPVTFHINGQEVQRTASDAVIDVEMDYRAVSASGMVKLTRGMIPTYLADMVRGQAPQNSRQPLERYSYFQLRDEPVLCFALGEITDLDMEKIQVDSAEFNCENYGGTPRILLYNAGENTWEELKSGRLPAVISGSLLTRCLDDQGRLFIRLVPGAGGGNSNQEVYNPTLTLEGKVK